MRFRSVPSVLVALTVGFASVAGEPLPSPYRPSFGYPRFESKRAEPRVSYGQVPGLSLPRTLLYSVNADELLNDAETWVDHGYAGFFLTGVVGEWSTDIWGADGEPWTIGESDKTLQKVRLATERCRSLGADVFLTSAFSHYFDWFDDVAWQRIEHQFEQMVVFARESGCTGLAIDVEYIHPQYHFIWEGYDYDSYTRNDLVDKIRARMTRVAEVMYDAWPEMVLLTLPESMTTLASHIQTSWIEVAAKRNAPGGVHICTEYTYRRPNLRFMLGHAWMINSLMERLLSKRAFEYWRERGSIAEGIWVFGIDPDDFHGAEPAIEEYRQAFAASLMAGRRYNWIYSHTYRPMLLGKADATYAPKGPLEHYVEVVKQRDIVTDAVFLDVARAVRSVAPFDYERALGLTIVPTLAGPREELEIGLMPDDVYAPTVISSMRDRFWNTGMRILRGEEVDVRSTFDTITEWQLIGPFDNTENRGFDGVYPPETEIDLGACYDTAGGKVAWTPYTAPDSRATIDLTKIFNPTEDVCAYALCYVSAPDELDVQIRLGANDSWKLWVDGALAAAYAEDGRIILDREIVPVKLKKGVTPILLKICNKKKDWGFVLRITGQNGSPATPLKVGAFREASGDRANTP